MRLFGLLCVRNEASRYLTDCLLWHSSIVDDLFVYDDQSDDETATLATSMGAWVVTRPDDVASFAEHEGEFRQAAWEAFEQTMLPFREDWVLALDADEFLVSNARTERKSLELLARCAELDGCNAVTMHFNEVFGKDDPYPLVRTDGFWGEIDHPRFFRYQSRGHYANRKMGGGSTPTYVNPTEAEGHVSVLHYGYYRAEDRARKHAFYSSMNHGHNAQHIDSIIASRSDMTLEPWTGKTPWTT